MSKTTIGFVYAGMMYFLVGVTLGVLFYIVPETRRLQTIHVHVNLVGFVTFLIFGIAYHILPRFRGRPLHSEGLAWVQFWMANVGLAGLLIVNGLRGYEVVGNVTSLQISFGALLALSFYLFAYNMLRTLVPKVAR